MPDNTIPFDYYTPQLIPALIAGGEKAKADDIMDKLTARSIQILNYYQSHDGALFDDAQRGYLLTLQSVYQAASNPMVNDQVRAQKAYAVLEPYLRSQQ